MPVLEKLQAAEALPGVVLLGVSDEPAAMVRDWLRQNHRAFRTLVNGKQAFEDFGVGPIPSHVVINRDGTVVRYFIGFNPERWSRQMLKDVMRDGR